ncbi:MAG: ATP cone domain-containing protein [Candidatus Micrarchaeota archaeon]|nr:ATP cone domain-containing protein [Candidatus Micrarchaeota archaeon]
MTDVVKSSGSKEPFDEKKLRRSIEKAVIDSGASVEKKKKTIDKVAKDVTDKARKKAVVTTGMLKSDILAELEQFEPLVAEAWRDFDRKYKSI